MTGLALVVCRGSGCHCPRPFPALSRPLDWRISSRPSLVTSHPSFNVKSQLTSSKSLLDLNIKSRLTSSNTLLDFNLNSQFESSSTLLDCRAFRTRNGRYSGDIGREKLRRRSSIRAHSSTGAEVHELSRWSMNKADVEVLIVAIATALLSTANKILYKMALVPMKEYPFFLAQLTTFGYVLVYFTILFWRYKAGIVTDDMLSVPKRQFVALGALEALGLATGMAAAAVLPAASIPVLLQVFLVWQLILSATFLGKRYTNGQIVGCLLVVTGVMIVVASGGGTESLQETGIFWPVVMIISSLFSAGGTILKESAFINAKHEVKGGNIDLFVVNSFGSGFQALFVLLLLPFLSNMRGIPFLQLGSYLKDGSACFFNVGSPVGGCHGSPLVPLLYVFCNMGFNVTALYLMKISSAILSSLCTTSSVPLAIYAFTLPLPYLGIPPPLPPKLLLGSAILVIGLAAYNLSNPKAQATLG